MDVWELILADRFEEACDEADNEFSLTGSYLPRKNKVIALLKLNRLEEAEALCRSIRECSTKETETESESVFLGVVNWLQDKRANAIEEWLRATTAHYRDAGGGVQSRLLLLFASKVERRPDLKELAIRELRKIPPNGAWPAPLASFALGRLLIDQVRERISDIEALRCKQSCQADFYFGVLSDDLSKHKEHLWRAAWDYVPESYIKAEHYLAIFEFNNLRCVDGKK